MKSKIIMYLVVFIILVFPANARLTINNIIIPESPLDTFQETITELEQRIKVDALYVHANGQRIAKIEESDGQRELLFFHNDHLGSPRAISNVQGKVIEKIDYLPFGATLSPQTEKIQYNSKELDFDTGLLYYGARYYNADVGRFVTADIVKGNLLNPQSLNLYVYTLNNPMKYIDPTGNQPLEGVSLSEFLSDSIVNEDLSVTLDPSRPTQGIRGGVFSHLKKLFTGDFKGFIEDYEGFNPSISVAGTTGGIGKIAGTAAINPATAGINALNIASNAVNKVRGIITPLLKGAKPKVVDKAIKQAGEVARNARTGFQKQAVSGAKGTSRISGQTRLDTRGLQGTARETLKADIKAAEDFLTTHLDELVEQARASTMVVK